MANSLLKGANAEPDVVGDEVTAELALIEAASGPNLSPILGYLEDYSQYKPRGHYTRSEQLKRYFKAMMWYGHTAFYVNPREPELPDATAASLSRRAVLISSSLVGQAKKAWSALYEPTSFLVGRADDLTVDDVQKVVEQVFGTFRPAPDELADTAKMAELRTELNKLPAPKIQTAVLPGNVQDREAVQRSFRLMGQRYIPDSYAFQQLVWDYVGTAPDSKRDLPLGLDHHDRPWLRSGLQDRETGLLPGQVRQLGDSTQEGVPRVSARGPRTYGLPTSTAGGWSRCSRSWLCLRRAPRIS